MKAAKDEKELFLFICKLMSKLDRHKIDFKEAQSQAALARQANNAFLNHIRMNPPNK